VAADPAEFVRRFQRAWDGEGLEFHTELWTEGIELHQPLLGSLYGPEECQRGFSKLFVLSPDLTTTVDDWRGDSDSLYIAFTFSTIFGGAELRWPAVDRFRLSEDGLILRRDSFFDLSLVMRLMLRHPRGWPRVLRAGIVPRRATPPPWPGRNLTS
jgi:SnoaL-like domain